MNNKRRLQSAIRPGHGAVITGLRNNNSNANVGLTFADRIANKYKERGMSAHGCSESNIKGVRNMSRSGNRLGSANQESKTFQRRRTA